MPTTPVGPIAEPIDLFRQLLEATQAWQDWAGAEYADRIYFNENRSHIELDQGTQAWFNTTLAMPFVILWQPELEMEVTRCLYRYNIALLFQAEATDRNDHNESFLAFTTAVGKVLDEINAAILSADETVPNAPVMKKAGVATRLNAEDSDVRNDFWTTTYVYEVNE